MKKYVNRKSFVQPIPKPQISRKGGDQKQNQTFQLFWYELYACLVGSNVNRKVVFFKCFGSNDSRGCTVGMSELRNFIRKTVTQAYLNHFYKIKSVTT